MVDDISRVLRRTWRAFCKWRASERRAELVRTMPSAADIMKNAPTLSRQNKRFLWFLSKSFYSFNRKVKISARQIATATRLARFLGAMINAPRLLVQNLFLTVHDVNAFAGISHAAAGEVVNDRLLRLPESNAYDAGGRLHFLFY